MMTPAGDVVPDMQIDIWSDIACPWCYIGKRRLETALADHPQRNEIAVTWHSYQLDPSLPEHYDGTEVEYLASRKGMPEEQVRQMFAHVTEQAAGEDERQLLLALADALGLPPNYCFSLCTSVSVRVRPPQRKFSHKSPPRRSTGHITSFGPLPSGSKPGGTTSSPLPA